MRLIDADELKNKAITKYDENDYIEIDFIDEMPTIDKFELTENSVIKVTFDSKKIKGVEAVKMFDRIKSMFPDNKVLGIVDGYGCDIDVEEENEKMTSFEKWKQDLTVEEAKEIFMGHCSGCPASWQCEDSDCCMFISWANSPVEDTNKFAEEI